MQSDSDQRDPRNPERHFEPDKAPVKALFMITFGFTAGVFVVAATVWQFFMATSEAEREAKAGAPLPQLVELRLAEQAELTSYGRVGCPETRVPTEPAAGAAAGAAEECAAADAQYHIPVAQAAEKVLLDASLLTSIALPEAAAPSVQGEGKPQRLRLAPGTPGGRALTVKNPALLRKRLGPADAPVRQPPRLPTAPDRADAVRRKR